MEITIDPVVGYIGSFEIRWYGLLLILAAVLALMLILMEARRLGIARWYTVIFFSWEVLFKLVFARVFLFLDRGQASGWELSSMLSPSLGRLDGAVFGSFLLILIFARITKNSFWRLSDLIAPSIAVAMLVGRVACSINGCCFGQPCDLPLAVIYTDPNSRAPVNMPLYPVQVYQAIWYAAVFAVIWSVRKSIKPVGSLYLLFIILHAAGDLVTRFFRTDNSWAFGLQQAQVLSILMLLICLPLYVIRQRDYRKGLTAVAEQPDASI
jgi:phosphatidylglycerol---prolipoprotein diacylglyceryl transferase